VHRGTAAVINGTERTFLDKYSDYFWFALLVLSGIGSAAAWLRRYLNRDDRDDNTSYRNRILSVVSEVRGAESEKDLQALQRESREGGSNPRLSQIVALSRPNLIASAARWTE